MKKPRQPDLKAKRPIDVWVLANDEPQPEGTYLTPTAHDGVWLAWKVEEKKDAQKSRGIAGHA